MQDSNIAFVVWTCVVNKQPMEEASVSDVGGCQDEEFLSTLRRWQKCKEMAGKLQGKVRTTWGVKPDGSLDTGARVDVAQNQLERRGASLA